VAVADTKDCPECGEQIRRVAKVCKHCGWGGTAQGDAKALRKRVAQLEADARSRPGPVSTVLRGCGCLIVAALGLWLLLRMAADNRATSADGQDAQRRVRAQQQDDEDRAAKVLREADEAIARAARGKEVGKIVSQAREALVIRGDLATASATLERAKALDATDVEVVAFDAELREAYRRQR
jgi:hypothetical protein